MTLPSSAPVRVFCVTRIGDLVFATATFDALVERYGGIHLVTSTLAEGLLDGDPRVERVDVLRHPDGLRGRASLLAHLLEARRAGQPVVNYEVFPPRWRFIRRTARLLGVEAHHLDLDAFLAANRSGGTGRHVTSYYADVVDIGPEPAPPTRLPVAAGAAEEAQRVLGDVAAPVVAVHPGSHAGWTSKRVAPDLVAEVVRRVAGGMSGTVLFVGGRNEAELCAAVREASGIGERGVNLAGRVSLGGLTGVLRRADVFLGGDSGPLKIAEAVGTATVSLWTVTEPAWAGPRGARHVVFRVGRDGPSPQGVADAVLSLLPPVGGGP